MPGTMITHRQTEAENGDWAITFADMMTLLLCFFILIVAISTVDKAQYQAVSDTIGKAMGADPSAVQEVPAKDPILEIRDQLKRVIGADTRGVHLQVRPSAVAVQLKGAVLFDRGRAVIKKEAVPVLRKIAKPLLHVPYDLAVEGHTDNLPIASSRFPSNWELSASRAGSVARFLIDQGFPKQYIRVVGLADTRPVVPNEDENGLPIMENMARNRRVVMLVAPRNRR